MPFPAFTGALFTGLIALLCAATPAAEGASELLDACYDIKPSAPDVRCPTGEARITPGFRLRAKYVIHSVGPIYEDPETSAMLLHDAIKSPLELARDHGIRSIAFPAISCGIYGYPPEEAAEVAIVTMMEFCEGIDLIEFVLFGRHTFIPFVEVAAELLERVEETDDDVRSEGHAETEARAGREDGKAATTEGHGSEGDYMPGAGRSSAGGQHVRTTGEKDYEAGPSSQENSHAGGEVRDKDKNNAEAPEPTSMTRVASEGKTDAEHMSQQEGYGTAVDLMSQDDISSTEDPHVDTGLGKAKTLQEGKSEGAGDVTCSEAAPKEGEDLPGRKRAADPDTT